MIRNRKGQTLPQIKRSLRQSTAAIRIQGKRERRLRARRQKAKEISGKFERPLTQHQMQRMREGRDQAIELAINKPGTVLTGVQSVGLFDRKNSVYIIDGRTTHSQIVDGPFRKHRVAYVHNLRGEFLHKLTYLKKDVMAKMHSKKNHGNWVDLGKNWRGRFDPVRNQFQVSKTMERGKITEELVFTHDLKGREISE